MDEKRLKDALESVYPDLTEDESKQEIYIPEQFGRNFKRFDFSIILIQSE